MTMFFEPGEVFCDNMHAHDLNGRIAEDFDFNFASRFELEASVGQALYLEITRCYLGLTDPNTNSDTQNRRPALISGKTAYVVAVAEGEEPGWPVGHVQILYKYDLRWWLATATRK